MSGDCLLIRYQSMKTREIADTPEKGQKRYWLYRSVIDRYNEAYKSGYYLEAITLMESLITDRLESLLIYHGLITPNKAFMTLLPATFRVCEFTIKRNVADRVFICLIFGRHWHDILVPIGRKKSDIFR